MDDSPRKVEPESISQKAIAASADPAADLARKFYHSPLTITLVDLEQAAAHIHRLLRERDAALASIGASDAANSIGDLVGASAHDLHLATEQRLAEQLVQCRAERDAALRERDDLMRKLKGIGMSNEPSGESCITPPAARAQENPE